MMRFGLEGPVMRTVGIDRDEVDMRIGVVYVEGNGTLFG